jgi:hypothetical protein
MQLGQFRITPVFVSFKVIHEFKEPNIAIFGQSAEINGGMHSGSELVLVQLIAF